MYSTEQRLVYSSYDDVLTAQPTLDSQIRPGRILSGLVISGFLLALPGGLLPLWGYHVNPDFGVAANYFLALGAGLTGGSLLAMRLRMKYPQQHLLAAGCFGAALVLLLLSFAQPPASAWYQAFVLLIAGAASGIINTTVFDCIAPAYEKNPAAITLMGGGFFGAGSVLAAWLMAQCVDATAPARWTALAALVPAAAGWMAGRLQLKRASVQYLAISETTRDLRSVLAILFALLLFFQFANEWSIAGWLPVYLIDRLGMSPSNAVSLLAVYWLALTIGRLVTARLLPLVRHGRLLAISAFCALFGCVALVTDTTFGVVSGILLTGAGFSAIYPLAAERIATRFTYYHPGYFNGIFTFAMMGGIIAPFVLGHIAAIAGLKIVPIAAMAGSCAVFALALVISLGRKVSGS
jgi:FHS family glucose/mannose:H+ symporter-like MFS transporter